MFICYKYILLCLYSEALQGWTNTLQSNIYESYYHFAEWKMSGAKGCILYDSMYMKLRTDSTQS